MNKLSNLILALIVPLFLSCDGNPSGEGPGFPAGITAADLWISVSGDLYLPDEANDDDEAISGTFACADGGKASVQHTKSGTVEDVQVTYIDCRAPEFIKDTNYDVTRNGTVSLHLNLISETEGDANFSQSVSYSGELGFFAQCNYSVVAQSMIVNYTGQCFYIDSEGAEFTFDAEQMESTDE